ncbi:prepilin-type N-terminal cleavage/methylation domain-containing protein [Microcystis flos-aquae FACHB-1344]|uniref:Prepilin-type N-terminal cleavage/methylation domain-containing protein n=1 Tax=Microcystis flos-aquae FACHB-1344 TaxID=2692899 RepID=A0ABR8HW30_9CHRO|nr:type IV pilin-like G/H family protein [Microcystis flos-aquae]MBD2622729.1 prepilin-type N-terminal cleavage/methylation domain-containing protein [Microcystis flos-aquae FACHB-1344]
MNSTFKFKLIQALNKKNRNKGFTLIELLVVVIIIGVLAAIALPNLLGQVAKGRQAEARNNLGTVNRAQQANRLENATFTEVSNLPVTATSTYYGTFTDQAAGNRSALGAAHIATANSTYTNDILDYGSAVGQTTSGAYTAVICEQTSNPSAAPGLLTVGPGTATAACVNGARLIQ